MALSLLPFLRCVFCLAQERPALPPLLVIALFPVGTQCDEGATPPELLKAGIYSKIAVALKGGPWREASRVMLAEAVADGMVPVDTGFHAPHWMSAVRQRAMAMAAKAATHFREDPLGRTSSKHDSAPISALSSRQPLRRRKMEGPPHGEVTPAPAPAHAPAVGSSRRLTRGMTHTLLRDGTCDDMMAAIMSMPSPVDSETTTPSATPNASRTATLTATPTETPTTTPAQLMMPLQDVHDEEPSELQPVSSFGSVEARRRARAERQRQADEKGKGVTPAEDRLVDLPGLERATEAITDTGGEAAAAGSSSDHARGVSSCASDEGSPAMQAALLESFQPRHRQRRISFSEPGLSSADQPDASSEKTGDSDEAGAETSTDVRDLSLHQLIGDFDESEDSSSVSAALESSSDSHDTAAEDALESGAAQDALLEGVKHAQALQAYLRRRCIRSNLDDPSSVQPPSDGGTPASSGCSAAIQRVSHVPPDPSVPRAACNWLEREVQEACAGDLRELSPVNSPPSPSMSPRPATRPSIRTPPALRERSPPFEGAGRPAEQCPTPPRRGPVLLQKVRDWNKKSKLRSATDRNQD